MEVVQDDIIGVGLWMHNYGETIMTPIILETIRYPIGVKLPTIVKYHGSRHSVLDNVFSDAFLYFISGDVSHDLSLHQLSKVIDCYH